MEEAIVKTDDLVKAFGEVVAVDRVSIDVYAGEFFSILGPSGCGKTTLLRLIAGLEESDSGAIYLHGELINTTPPYRRDVNTVFQNYALFPHMNVYENIAFGLRMKRIKKDSIDYRVSKSLELVGLSGMESRKPGQLSGGQQQRIALARALVNEPSVLLLDEPLGALDLKLRKQMQIELKSLQKRLGITFIYVTHDQEEALTMSDRIAVMRSGRIERVGTPSQVYEEPDTEFVANFIGISNLFSGEVKDSDASILTLITQDGVEIKAHDNGLKNTGTINVMVRPEKIQLSKHEPEQDNIVQGIIEDAIYLGTVIQFIISLDERKLIVLEKNDKERALKPGQRVFASWDISSTVILRGTSPASPNDPDWQGQDETGN